MFLYLKSKKLYINSLLTRHKGEKYVAFDTVDSYATLKRFAVLSW